MEYERNRVSSSDRTRAAAAVCAAAVVAIAMSAHPACATEYMVSTAAQIATAMQTAQPGDILTMTNGNLTNQSVQFAGNGTAALPITLRAQKPGLVILNGNSKLNISGSYLVADGLSFDVGAMVAGHDVVEFRGT